MSKKYEPNQSIKLAKFKIVEVAGQTVEMLRLLPSPTIVITSDRFPNLVQSPEHFSISRVRVRSKVQPNPLRSDGELLDIDDLYGQAKVCLACHK